MSPFARFLKDLRGERGYRQKELAHHLGYEPAYLSALERGDKGPPRQGFINRLIRGLSLSQEEQAALQAALKASRRQFSLPHHASDAEFEMIHRLAPQLGRLHPVQVQLIQIALSLPEVFGNNHGPAEHTPTKEDHIM